MKGTINKNDPWVEWLHRTWLVLRIPLGILAIVQLLMSLGIV